MRRVRVSAPCRVDLAGGTLDIWPLGLLHPGSQTVNVAIDLRVTIDLEPSAKFRIEQQGSVMEVESVEQLCLHPETALAGTFAQAFAIAPFRAIIQSDSPRSAGLGASSTLGVALLTGLEALFGISPSNPARCARIVRDLEARLMGLPTGLQDHYPALLGGALRIEHLPGGERVTSLPVDLDRLSESLLVFYTGQSHFSAGNNWQVVRQRLDGDPRLVAALDGVRDAANEVAKALEAEDLEALGVGMSAEWAHRRTLATEISTPAIETGLQAAREAGAWGGKACGAGGGGCIAVLASAGRRDAVRQAVESAGLRWLSCGATKEGIVLS